MTEGTISDFLGHAPEDASEILVFDYNNRRFDIVRYEAAHWLNRTADVVNFEYWWPLPDPPA